MNEFVLAMAVTVALLLLVIGPMAGLFGGALFNPVHNGAAARAGAAAAAA